MLTLVRIASLVIAGAACCAGVYFSSASVDQPADPPQQTETAASEDETLHPTPDPTSKSGVYVPKDLDDALQELSRMLPRGVTEKMRQGTEDDMVMYHRSLGLWMRNNWGLWAGSRLAKYFNSLGLHHPDDMSSLILDAFWYRLHDKPLPIEDRVGASRAYWEQMEEPKTKKCPDDGSKFEITQWLYGDDESASVRIAHVGRCREHGHIWLFEHGRGWYRPTEDQLKRIDTSNAGSN